LKPTQVTAHINLTWAPTNNLLHSKWSTYRVQWSFFYVNCISMEVKPNQWETKQI